MASATIDAKHGSKLGGKGELTDLERSSGIAKRFLIQQGIPPKILQKFEEIKLLSIGEIQQSLTIYLVEQGQKPDDVAENNIYYLAETKVKDAEEPYSVSIYGIHNGQLSKLQSTPDFLNAFGMNQSSGRISNGKSYAWQLHMFNGQLKMIEEEHDELYIPSS